MLTDVTFFGLDFGVHITSVWRLVFCCNALPALLALHGYGDSHRLCGCSDTHLRSTLLKAHLLVCFGLVPACARHNSRFLIHPTRGHRAKHRKFFLMNCDKRIFHCWGCAKMRTAFCEFYPSLVEVSRFLSVAALLFLLTQFDVLSPSNACSPCVANSFTIYSKH